MCFFFYIAIGVEGGPQKHNFENSLKFNFDENCVFDTFLWHFFVQNEV